MKKSSALTGSLAALILAAGHCTAASTVVAQYGMGELEYNGGAGTQNGQTATTLLPSTGATNMSVTGTPVLNVGTGASNAFGSAGGSTAYMSFDGVQERYEVASNILSTDFATNWMMEAWVRPTDSGSGLGAILSHGHGGTGVLLNYDAVNNLYGYFIGGVGQFNGTTGTSVVGTSWDHLALVHEGGTLFLYVNGVQTLTNGYTGGYVNGSAIGSQFSGGGDHGFTGDIDDVYFSTVSGFNVATDLHITAVPEPSTYGLIGAGALAGVALVRRRRKTVA